MIVSPDLTSHFVLWSLWCLRPIVACTGDCTEPGVTSCSRGACFASTRVPKFLPMCFALRSRLAQSNPLPRPIRGGAACFVATRARTADPRKLAAPLAAFLGRELPRPQVLSLSEDEIEKLLSTNDKVLVESLYSYADELTKHIFGKKVYLRGIIEFSNVCEKNCFYCGIRRESECYRYTMKPPEIIRTTSWAWNNYYGTLMLQSGEIQSSARVAWLCRLLRNLKRLTAEPACLPKAIQGKNSSVSESDSEQSEWSEEDTTEHRRNPEGPGICLALSVGELASEQYLALQASGADRFLLRIETSNPELYAQLHPIDNCHSWQKRHDCLMMLKQLGFQLGTGVMVGLPGQTTRDMARDILYFLKLQPDMLGIGPYICEANTPLGRTWLEQHKNIDKKKHYAHMLDLSTRMYALGRITLGDVNIAATTALQVVDPLGREKALLRGANVVMPILTDTKYRENYQLYEGKPCVDERASQCHACLSARIRSVGREPAWKEWGDPPSFHRRQQEKHTGN